MAKYSTVTEAGFITYNEERGRTIPGTADTDDINSALLVASEWIDNTYGDLFVGQKTAGFLQDREWPRTGAAVNDPRYGYAFSDSEIPQRVNEAVYEAAWRQLISPGSLLVDYTPRKYKSVDIDGAIAVEYTQFSSSAEIQTTYPIIDQLLGPLLRDEATYSSYSGASVRA